MKAISELNNFDKPREKLTKKGVQALKDYELLAIVLGSGTKDKDVLKLSREIVKLFEDDFDNINLEKLTSIHGLGVAKASQILSAIELSKRYLIKQNKKITSSQDIYDLLQEYKSKKQEYFITITLDGANHIIEQRVISIGTLNRSLIHPREVFADAITDRAASIIIAHNHPSGILETSDEDILVTKRLQESAKLLGIELLDHLIISKNGYLSMRDLELL
ncbi:DNA repair protein RadC [bacterium]|nr:DNA repair protein RadC [bacterium]MBU1883098.1 DNA repair protein RadC [bacterium]